jgi:RNA polymerase sigma-70 factor, ECF subfamily
LPEEVVIRQNEAEILKEWMAKLSPEQFNVLQLRYFNGCTMEEAADLLGIPLGTVKSRGSGGIKRIRSFYDENVKRGEMN